MALRRPREVVPLVRRLALLLLTALCASLVIANPLLASGKDVITDLEEVTASGSGTIDRCYTAAEFQEALKIARDRAMYGGAVAAIQDKRAECAQTAAPTDLPKSDDSGTSPWIAIGGVLLIAAVAAAAYLARRQRHEDQFEDADGGDGPPSGS